MAAQYELRARRHRVLVVDDDPESANALAAVLSMSPTIDAEPAYGGVQALHAARASRPTAVVLDMEMPPVTGFQVADALVRAFPGNPPRLIAVTGNPALCAAALQDARFADALLKPADLVLLMGALEDAFAGRPPPRR